MADHPLRVVGYANTTDEQGSIVLYASRSAFDVKAEEVLIAPVVLKQLAATYMLAEARGELEALGLAPHDSSGGVIPAAVRLTDRRT